MSVVCTNQDTIRTQLLQVIRNRRPVELRCIKDGRCNSGLFDDPDRLAHEALQANQSGANCYVSLNKIHVAQAGVTNALGSKAITAEGVTRIESILVDIDPVRPSKTGSTDEEKKAAVAVLDELVSELEKLGWPQPLNIDSGNGCHAIFPTDLATENCQSIKLLLYALSQRFDTKHVKVDTSVADPSRVTRLPGTFNYKGLATDERPHRMAQVVKAAVRTELVTLQQIHDAIFELSTSRLTSDQTASDADLEEARQWLSEQRNTGEATSNEKALSKLAAALVIDIGLSTKNASALLKDYRDQHKGRWTNKQIDELCLWACTKIASSMDRFGKKQILVKTCGDDESKKSDADRLVDLVLPTHRLSYTSEKETYASVPLPTGGVVNFRTTSIDYRHRLTGTFYEVIGKIPSATSVSNAIETLSGLALINGEQCETCLRVAAKDGVYYVDTGDAEWNCIAIDKDGWRIITDPPVMFRRGTGFETLPTPSRDGNIGPLIDYLNVSGEKDFILLIAFLLVGFNAQSEYPVLLLYGEQGTSKSTTAIILRSLCDPNIAPLRNNPRNDDDFATAGYNNHVVVFDNLSYIDGNLSDNLCRMSTGATLSKRQQYTNRDEVLVRYKNLVILNGITDLAQRADLLNRAITIDLPKIRKRRSSTEFKESFQLVAPRILGGLLDAVAWAQANPITGDVELPRMAEFCRFIMSAEPELARQWNEFIADDGRVDSTEWKVGDFYRAYMDNIDQSSVTAAEQVPFLHHLERLLGQSPCLTVRMSATSLLSKLKSMAGMEGEATFKGTGWPQSGTAMGSMLQRLVPVFRELGITAVRERKSGGNRERTWVLVKKPPTGTSQNDTVEPVLPPV